MKIVEAQGYSKDKALATTDLDIALDRLKNATQAWKKAGSPVSDKTVKTFVEGYFKKNKSTVGIYIVVDAAVDDTRSRPYTIVNEVTNGARKYKTYYQVKEAELVVKEKTVEKEVTNEEGITETVEEKVKYAKVVSTEVAVAKASKKAEAVAIMKELIEANKCDYTIELVKEVEEGQSYAAHGVYTPSKSAKQGKFMFFVNE